MERSAFRNWTPAFAGVTVEGSETARMSGYVYILASQRNGTLYIGVTSDIGRQIWEHREGLVEGFTTKYGVSMLVYCETFDRIDDAIRREKQLKEWKRDWKLRLIEKANPEWADLAGSIL